MVAIFKDDYLQNMRAKWYRLERDVVDERHLKPCVCVCVCVCVCGRGRGGVRICVRERKRERERETDDCATLMKCVATGNTWLFDFYQDCSNYRFHHVEIKVLSLVLLNHILISTSFFFPSM